MGQKRTKPTTVARTRPAGLAPLELLLASQTRAALLTAFCTRPTQEFYSRQLARDTRRPLASVQREVGRLERLGLITMERRGKEKYYRLNERHPFFSELKRLVYKSAALGDVIREALTGVEGVEAAFIYGSVAKGGERPTSDIDLFVLGTPDQSKLAAALREAEGRLGREISLVIMAPDEWRRRRDAREGFARELLRTDKIFLVGDEQFLRRA